MHYYIFKLSSNRFNDEHSTIVQWEEGIKTGELIRIEDSQMLRSIRLQKNYKCRLISSNKTLIEDLISIVIESDKFYDTVTENQTGLIVNKQHYIRLMCPPSQGRKRTVFFIKSSMFSNIHTLFMNGMDATNIIINPSKFNSYYSLYASSSTQVSNPRVCVIDDYFVKPVGEVHFVDDQNQIVKKDAQLLPFLELNVWDGQGLISPKQAAIWSQILMKKDNILKPYCNFGVRHSFIKGCVCTFDFQLLAQKLSVETITDIWGHPHAVDHIDMIISKSMMKINTQGYSSWAHYTSCCKKNNLHWGVTIVNKIKDDEMKTTNYQYLQALNLSQKDIEEIAHYSVKLIKEIKSERCQVEKLLLFLSNTIGTEALQHSSPFIQALMIAPPLLHDPYIKRKVNQLLKKTIEKMSIGKLLLPGNYQIMISDPYAQALFALGHKPIGLLQKRQYYSQFWNKKNIQKVCASRSPLTDYSEHQTLDFIQNKETDFWYQYLYSGIIYPIGGLDTFIHAGHDYDGDKVYTTSHPTIISAIAKNKNSVGRNCSIPPTCHQPKPAPKLPLCLPNGTLDFQTLCQADKNIFGNDIGAIANYGASLYALLARYPEKKHPKEYYELRHRLTALYRESSNSIDKGKGIEVTPFPKTWVSRQKIQPKDSKQIAKEKKFFNKLAIVRSKKPLFMIHIYPQLKKEYQLYITSWEDQCFYDFGLSLQELLLAPNKTAAQYQFIKRFHLNCPVYLDSCNVNNIFYYIENLHLQSFPSANQHLSLIDILGYQDTKLNQKDPLIKKFKKIYNQYVAEKKEYTKYKKEQGLTVTDSTALFYSITKDKIQKLGIESTQALKWAVLLSKGHHTDFIWEILGEELVTMLTSIIPQNNHIKVLPCKSNTANAIEYLGQYYKAEGGNYFDYSR